MHIARQWPRRECPLPLSAALWLSLALLGIAGGDAKRAWADSLSAPGHSTNTLLVNAALPTAPISAATRAAAVPLPSLLTNSATLGLSTQAAAARRSPALDEFAAQTATSNLLTSLHQPRGPTPLAGFAAQLELARQLRRDKVPELAAARLEALLGNPRAPADIQHEALLELALIVHAAGQLARAQQIYSQYVQACPTAPNVPEVLLRQGLLYREMGAFTNALNKFFAVFSSALAVKLEQMDYYQRLVLQAQTEIAETQYLQGRYPEAAFDFARLLKLESPDLNRAQIRFKLIQCLAQLGRDTELAAQAEEFLARHAAQPEEPEVRYLRATALKRLGRNHEAMQQVMHLLESQQSAAAVKPETWSYWQQRTGNDIANQLYKEGDFQNALLIYQQLALLNDSPAWQMPVLYQVGLVLERLRQPGLAAENYDRVIARAAQLQTNAVSPNLAVLVDMAKWRKNYLAWQTNADAASRRLAASPAFTNVLTAVK